jgi:hypothetical protein
MVDKRSKQSQSKKDDIAPSSAPSDGIAITTSNQTTVQNSPVKNPVEIGTRPSAAPGLSATSKSNAQATSATTPNERALNSTEIGVEDRPESPDLIDEDFLGLLRQAPGEQTSVY